MLFSKKKCQKKFLKKEYIYSMLINYIQIHYTYYKNKRMLIKTKGLIIIYGIPKDMVI